MTALNSAPAPGLDLGGLAALPGLEMAAGQLTPLVTVLRAEQARRTAGIAISRPAWKNLVFTGGPGTGKSRAARALARLYKDLGLLTYGQLIEIAAADLAGATPRDTAAQVAEVIKPTGDLLLITGTHAWHALPDRGQHLLSCLYQQMTAAHRDHEGHPDELAIIVSGRKQELRALLVASPRAGRPVSRRHRLPRLHPRPARRHPHRPGQRSRAASNLRAPSARPPPSWPRLRNVTPPVMLAWPSAC